MDADGRLARPFGKFDIPNASVWVSERVYSIPLVPGAASRSPLYGVDDEIEKCVLFPNWKKRELMSHDDLHRKYRVLDDCARLREVIETFPDDRLATFSLSSKTKDLDEKFHEGSSWKRLADSWKSCPGKVS
jgi:hypothetical protein